MASLAAVYGSPGVASSEIHPTRIEGIRILSKNGAFRALAGNRGGAQELVHRPAAGFMRRRNFVVDRSFSAKGPLGSPLGISGCLVAVCAAPWAGARFDRTLSCRYRTLEGLASPGVCFASLCGD